MSLPYYLSYSIMTINFDIIIPANREVPQFKAFECCLKKAFSQSYTTI